jgi:hypothetical protein
VSNGEEFRIKMKTKRGDLNVDVCDIDTLSLQLAAAQVELKKCRELLKGARVKLRITKAKIRTLKETVAYQRKRILELHRLR